MTYHQLQIARPMLALAAAGFLFGGTGEARAQTDSMAKKPMPAASAMEKMDKAANARTKSTPDPTPGMATQKAEKAEKKMDKMGDKKAM